MSECNFFPFFTSFPLSLSVMCCVSKGGRMEKVGLNITPKEFRQLSKWSENIYNTAVVMDYFVANQPEIEECYNLAPVVKHLRNDADVLNAFFIEHEKDIEF